MASQSILRNYYLQQMGIEPWIVREKPLQSPIQLVVAAPMIPLEGQAAILLQNMLKSIGLLPNHWFFFAEDVDINKPLLVLGIQSAHRLLNITQSLGDLRGSIHTHQGRSVVVTYHPHDLLQNPYDKKNAYQDLQQLQQVLLKTSRG